MGPLSENDKQVNSPRAVGGVSQSWVWLDRGLDCLRDWSLEVRDRMGEGKLLRGFQNGVEGGLRLAVGCADPWSPLGELQGLLWG